MIFQPTAPFLGGAESMTSPLLLPRDIARQPMQQLDLTTPTPQKPQPNFDGTNPLTSAATSGASMRLVAGAYPNAVLSTPGVRGYWRFGESSGSTAFDEQPPMQDGTYSGQTLGQSSLTGGVNTAVALNAGGVTMPLSTDLDVGDTFSFEISFKRARTGVRELLARKGMNGVRVTIEPDGTIALRKWLGSIIAATTVTVNDTDPHHLIVRKNGATVSLRLDGTDVTGSITNQTIAANPSDALVIGG